VTVFPARARGATVAALAALLAAGCSAGSTASTTPPPTGTPKASPTHASQAAARPRPRVGPIVIAVPPPPAYLHQTMAFPSAHTRMFSAEMTDLWAAVVADRPAYAIDAFFPLTAYQQVKAIADPTADWHNRLFGDFRLDVAAAHRLLGPGARKARLVRVIVPSTEASWIVPGVCSNGVGYWHVAESRVVYREHGQLLSFGIASLISWRGRWYVVHFGAVLRSAVVGVVDQPSPGTGTPGPPGGC
jgi:hypothetical protein